MMGLVPVRTRRWRNQTVLAMTCSRTTCSDTTLNPPFSCRNRISLPCSILGQVAKASSMTSRGLQTGQHANTRAQQIRPSRERWQGISRTRKVVALVLPSEPLLR